MPNPYNTEIKRGLGGGGMSPPSPGMKGGKGIKAKEKPAFSGMGAPGKTQPKNRSGGVKKAKVYPHSDGL